MKSQEVIFPPFVFYFLQRFFEECRRLWLFYSFFSISRNIRIRRFYCHCKRKVHIEICSVDSGQCWMTAKVQCDRIMYNPKYSRKCRARNVDVRCCCLSRGQLFWNGIAYTCIHGYMKKYIQYICINMCIHIHSNNVQCEYLYQYPISQYIYCPTSETNISRYLPIYVMMELSR